MSTSERYQRPARWEVDQSRPMSDTAAGALGGESIPTMSDTAAGALGGEVSVKE